jgi:hypothetical protein
MLAQAAKRDDTNSKWNASLKKNFKVTEEISIPREVVIPPFAYLNISGLILYSLIDSVALAGFAVSLSSLISSIRLAESKGLFVPLLVMIVMIICIIIVSSFLGKLIRLAVTHSSPKKNMTFIAKALLNTLQYCGLISDRATLNVLGDEVIIGISLKEANRYEQNLFNEAINEMFSPIDNPRYLLILEKKGHLKYQHSYSCPSILGKKKAMVDLFATNLIGKVGTFKVVYTRSDEGRNLILKCRKRSVLNENDRMTQRALKTKIKIS